MEAPGKAKQQSSILDLLLRHGNKEEEACDESHGGKPEAREVKRAEAVSLVPHSTEPVHFEKGYTLLKGSVPKLSNPLGHFPWTHKSDLVPGHYEGGFKLWESSVDLIEALRKEIQDGKLSFKKKDVLELGCGHGLPGILACLKGASSVHFQDFNSEVLINLTIPNVDANLGAATAAAESGESTAQLGASASPSSPLKPRSPRSLSPFNKIDIGSSFRRSSSPIGTHPKPVLGTSVSGKPITPRSPLPTAKTRFFAGDWDDVSTLLSIADDDVSKAGDDVSKAGDDVSKAGDYVRKVGDGISRIADDVSKTGGDACSAGNDISKTGDDVSKTGSDVSRTGGVAEGLRKEGGKEGERNVSKGEGVGSPAEGVALGGLALAFGEPQNPFEGTAEDDDKGSTPKFGVPPSLHFGGRTQTLPVETGQEGQAQALPGFPTARFGIVPIRSSEAPAVGTGQEPPFGTGWEREERGDEEGATFPSLKFGVSGREQMTDGTGQEEAQSALASTAVPGPKLPLSIHVVDEFPSSSSIDSKPVEGFETAATGQGTVAGAGPVPSATAPIQPVSPKASGRPIPGHSARRSFERDDSVGSPLAYHKVLAGSPAFCSRLGQEMGEGRDLVGGLAGGGGELKEKGGYDVILTAETVYHVHSLPKLLAIIKKCLRRPYGVVYLAGKKHYFGVGGGTRKFLELVKEDGEMKSHLLSEIADGASNVREVWKLFYKH